MIHSPFHKYSDGPWIIYDLNTGWEAGPASARDLGVDWKRRRGADKDCACSTGPAQFVAENRVKSRLSSALCSFDSMGNQLWGFVLQNGAAQMEARSMTARRALILGKNERS
jgi:hypothetical protein